MRIACADGSFGGKQSVAERRRRGNVVLPQTRFSKIDGSVIVAAMNQAFFTLSTGMGGMAIFGSYIGKDHSLMGEAVNIISLDTLVAIIAGVIIFPACFTYGVEVNSGPSLLFDTMATVFNNMAGGRIWGTLFSCLWFCSFVNRSRCV